MYSVLRRINGLAVGLPFVSGVLILCLFGGSKQSIESIQKVAEFVESFAANSHAISVYFDNIEIGGFSDRALAKAILTIEGGFLTLAMSLTAINFLVHLKSDRKTQTNASDRVASEGNKLRNLFIATLLLAVFTFGPVMFIPGSSIKFRNPPIYDPIATIGYSGIASGFLAVLYLMAEAAGVAFATHRAGKGQSRH